MFVLSDPDRSTVKQQDFFEPDLSVNPLPAAVRGFGAGMSLAPTVAQFMLGDDEPLVDELPSLLTMGRRGLRGTIAPLVDNAAEAATLYRARQEDAMMQSGMASNLSYGVSYYLSGFLGGGLNPASYGLGLGKARMETEIRAGVDEDTAFTIGAIEGVTAGFGATIPFLGKTVAQRFGFGVAANVVPGIAQRKAEQVTFGEVYAERAPDVFDPVALAVDSVMGGAFGYLAGLGAKPETIPVDAINDALDANINVRAADAAPGFPNPKAFGIHMRMVKETIDAQNEGRAPDYTPLLDAEFADSPEMIRNFEESLADVTAGRMTDDRPIYDDILPQIEATGVYSAPEARANAKLASMAYTAMAKRMGMNPRDLMDQMPLKVVTDAVDGFGQGNRASITFKPETNFLQAETPAGMVGGKVTDGTLRITYAEVAPESRGKGEGIKLYRALIDDALAKGLRVTSDSTVEAAAVRVYQSLEKAGYTVRRLEGGKLEDGAIYGRGAKEPAFEVTAGPLRQSSLPVLDSVNPTGSVFVDYTPQARANAPLADNMVTLDKTIGGSADDLITIYRGTIGDAIVAGDFVTTNKQLAKDYAGTGKVVEMQVKKGDVIDDLSEPGGEEYIYRPESRLNQETRGTYSPDTNTIGLTRAADSSTFVHELGHHLFEMLGKLAPDPNAPTQIRADFKTLVEHGGMKVDDWYASDINTRRAAHEKIADDFENYLMTGEAPSLELRNLFGMIRDWMLGVYKTIRGDVQPEVRAVFDRMLATDEQMAMKSQVVDYLAIQRQTEAKAKSSLDENLMAAERAIDPNVEVVIDGTRIKASELLKAEEPQEATAMQKLKECLLNV